MAGGSTSLMKRHRSGKSKTVLGLGRLLVLLLGLATTFGLVLWAVLAASLPQRHGTAMLGGLSAPVEVAFSARGVPRIAARNRLDAYRALGYLHAQDRLFQIDLFRRLAAGRLAELFGPAALDEDRWHRNLGFEQVAQRVVRQLPKAHRAMLRAYAEGVNAGIASLRTLPFEFLALRYRPEPWRPEDSVLVVLNMHAALSYTAERERMATVMAECFEPQVFRFFTQDRDPYTARLLGLTPAPPPLPVAPLATLLRGAQQEDLAAVPAVQPEPVPPGSNAWVVGGGRTASGRAVLANDMHLELSVPNIWYRAELHYEGRMLSGVSLPGAPVIVAGSNGRLAWGFTNAAGDFSDLVYVEPLPDTPDRYRTPEGSEPFRLRVERIAVRGGQWDTLAVRETRWGPVLDRPLLGRPVALRWTALDAEAVDFKLLDVDRVESVAGAVDFFREAGTPQLNVLLADRGGHIGWTYAGRFPLRRGSDGLTARSWADGRVGWQGWLEPAAVPFRIDPPEGFLVNANQPMLPTQQFDLGRGLPNGHRALRITERLRTLRDVTEEDLLQVQLDTGADFYRPYRDLALGALETAPAAPEWQDLAAALRAWDGRAERDTRGLPLLAEFRKKLMARVLSPYFAACRQRDATFEYRWGQADLPLLQLLDEAPPELLVSVEATDWPTLIRSVLQDSARALRLRHPDTPLAELRWGRVNRVHAAHPFGRALPILGRWLNMAPRALAGCPQCVRQSDPISGSSERLVVAPGHEAQGILHMPGGQSGHPLSRHYRDQQPAWRLGQPLPLVEQRARISLLLTPS